jgi:rhodanese-related sulfurtransferase
VIWDKLKRLIEPVESIDAKRARGYLADWEEGSYTLLDVRQPAEYEAGHIPGAMLIPLPQLSDSQDLLDKGKPVVVY